MESFNWLDYTLLGIMLLSILVGLTRGVIREVLSLLNWLIAFFVASIFSARLAAYFAGSSKVQTIVTSTTTSSGIDVSQPVSWLALGMSFTLIFIVMLMIGAIFNYFISRAVEGYGFSVVNRVLGGLFGLGRGLLINLVLLFLVQLIPDVSQQDWWMESSLTKFYQPWIETLNQNIQPGFETLKSKVGEKLQDVNTKVQNVITNYH